LADFRFNFGMSKLEQVEEQVKTLSIAEQQALRDWLYNLLEDRLELKDDFKAEIGAGIKDIADVEGLRREFQMGGETVVALVQVTDANNAAPRGEPIEILSAPCGIARELTEFASIVRP
jgi:hypothetical protein